MAGELTTVQFVGRFGVYMAGDIASFPPAIADAHIRSGLAVPADAPAEASTDEPKARRRAAGGDTDTTPVASEGALGASSLAGGGALVPDR